ncbi:MAG: exosortase A [Chromatiales bacterium]
MTTDNAAAAARRAAGPWPRAITEVALVLILILAIFHETLWSMVSIWLRSDTFAHGFLILPISLWLIWDRRRQIASLTPSRRYLGLLPLAAFGAVWLAARLVDIQVIQQFMLVAMLVSSAWVVLGDRVTRALLFPLGFLFFSVPVGEALVPPMMEFTATFTVELIRLTGIPVYREGLFFSLPSGNWSVVEACSGVRYLIAAVTLGVLYAYLTYRTLWKRLAFVAFSMAVPVVANGVRAYLIVMLAHWSDHRLAVGVDHLVYGWLFFGLVMLIMFSIGAIWREAPASADPPGGAPPDPPGRSDSLTAPLSALLVAALWSGLAWAIDHSEDRPAGADLAVPESVGQWQQIPQEAWTWTPRILGPDRVVRAFYAAEGQTVGVYVAQYNHQRQGAELINSRNVMVPERDKAWRERARTDQQADISGRSLDVRESEIAGGTKNLLTWHWYRVGDRYTSNRYVGKALEALSRLTFGRRDGALIAVTTPLDGSKPAARQRLAAFLRAGLPALENAMRRAAGQAPRGAG